MRKSNKSLGKVSLLALITNHMNDLTVSVCHTVKMYTRIVVFKAAGVKQKRVRGAIDR